ncbi:hypothetical protein CL3_22480 [butyrate-producing bacterium SM4/1]|nr:hypothetical protein CL3_22480 [butyrate-producing bacterium SM4/1]
MRAAGAFSGKRWGEVCIKKGRREVQRT